MKKVKLLKDLPGVKAGTFATQDGNFWDFIRDGMTLSFNDQELKDHPDWFEILPDRIELFWTTEDHRCLCLYDRSEITEEQRVLMEQAINGELSAKNR